ncbi:hypothetical protein D3C84_1100830 [compost metagenome]
MNPDFLEQYLDVAGFQPSDVNRAVLETGLHFRQLAGQRETFLHVLIYFDHVFFGQYSGAASNTGKLARNKLKYRFGKLITIF